MAHKKRKKQRNDDVRGLIDDAREESSAVASASRDVRSPEPQNNADSLRGERTLLAVPEMDMNSDEEGPEDVLLAKGKDQAIEQKRKEIQAVKRLFPLILGLDVVCGDDGYHPERRGNCKM